MSGKRAVEIYGGYLGSNEMIITPSQELIEGTGSFEYLPSLNQDDSDFYTNLEQLVRKAFAEHKRAEEDKRHDIRSQISANVQFDYDLLYKDEDAESNLSQASITTTLQKKSPLKKRKPPYDVDRSQLD
jgi:hypothetical protein